MTCKRKIKCIDCEHCKIERYNGSPSRYYCQHPAVIDDVGNMMICRCRRGSDDLTIKSSPVWCAKKRIPTEPKCKICGCTDDHACKGGCYWAAPNLCSKCVGLEDSSV